MQTSKIANRRGWSGTADMTIPVRELILLHTHTPHVNRTRLLTLQEQPPGQLLALSARSLRCRDSVRLRGHLNRAARRSERVLLTRNALVAGLPRYCVEAAELT